MRINVYSCVFICCFLSCFNISFSQITSDTFKVAGTPVNISITSEGTVLSNINECIDPYYHASAYIMSVLSFHIGNKVEIPVRITAENQNFSRKYGNESNFITWIKPSLIAKITTIPVIDSLNIHAGDLWRINYGRGLILDNFEAHGAKFKISFKGISLEYIQCGAGILGWDDLEIFSISYRNNFAVRFFNDLYNKNQKYDKENISRIISADAFSEINKNISLYSEIGLNIDSKNKAGLAGILIHLENPKYYLDMKAEFRHYDKSFLLDKYISDMEYFKSLTALDKPINSYIRYAVSPNLSNVFAGRITGRYYIYKNFFTGVDLEPILGDTTLLAYEAVIGCEVEKNVRLMFGIMNKFIYTDSEFSYLNRFDSMFYLRKKAWLMLKATFKI